MKKMKLTVTLSALFMAGLTQAQITSPAPYCDGSFDDAGGFTVSDAIRSVTLGTLTNNSGGQYAAPHYVYYNNLAAPALAAGTTIPMSITLEVHGGAGYGVWIDFNHNNIFETSEKVAGSTATGWLNMGNSIVVTPSIAIPASALTGETRMRVRIVEDDDYTMTNGAAILPCNSGTSAAAIMDWGETEDYKVNITGSSTGTRPVAAFTANTVTGIANSSVITFTDNSTNSPASRNWTFTPNTIVYQGSTSATSANPVVKFTAAGTYTVKLTVSNAAGKDSLTKTNYITITGSTAIGETSRLNASAFYPNPATNALYFPASCIGAAAAITDIYGKICLQSTPLSGNQIDISTLPSGIYFIRLTLNGITSSQKIMVHK